MCVLFGAQYNLNQGIKKNDLPLKERMRKKKGNYTPQKIRFQMSQPTTKTKKNTKTLSLYLPIANFVSSSGKKKINYRSDLIGKIGRNGVFWL
jgi:hypothetical protein